MKTFSIGGVHPSENKLSAGKKIETMALPKQAVFPLSQHIGAPAVACVAKGDMVKVGTKIADAGGFVSAAIFSSVSGKVAKIDSIIDASGYRKPAIFIDVIGDEWEESIDRSEDLVTECALEPAEIVAKIKDAGIVGMGGACFPTHVKLTPPPGSKAECVIINAVECEPYLTADHSLMLEKPEEILMGVSLIMKAVNVDKGYIGIENNKPDAIALMREKAAKYPNIEIVPLKVQYPQGGEKQLIDAAGGMPENTGKIIGGGPMMGKALLNAEVPICKGSSGVLLMTEEESVRGKEQNCIRCAKCVGACPMGLEPYLLAKLGEYSDWERAENEDIMTCIECGCCTFTCPSNRPLLDWIRLAKNTVGGIIRERNMKK